MADAADKNYAGVWDSRLGFGKKSAIIVIDLLQGYTTEGSALYAPGVVECVKEMPELLDAARAKGVPIIHTRVLYTAPSLDAEAKRLWTFFVDRSKAEFDRVYKILGIKHESEAGEAFYNDKMPAMVETLKAHGIPWCCSPCSTQTSC